MKKLNFILTFLIITTFSFSYDKIDEKVKSDRLSALQQLLDAQQLAFNKKCEGMRLPVLIEKQGSRYGQMTGRSPFMQSVYLEGEVSWIGQIMNLEIAEARQNSLLCTPIAVSAKGAA